MSRSSTVSATWQLKSMRRAAAERTGLDPIQWRQLEQLVDAGGAWLSTSATIPAGSPASPRDAGERLCVVRDRGLVECIALAGVEKARWRATEAGHRLIMQTRR